MPTSHLYQLNEILELISRTNPQTMLDIGVGFGKYGVLSREFLEFWDGRNVINDWKRRIDGIEAFKEYRNPVYDYVYNNIYFGNALEIIRTLDLKYDLIIIIDVIEHFPFDEGYALIEESIKKTKNLIISTPKDLVPQSDYYGNEFEVHKSQWKKKHFSKYKEKFFVDNELSIICYIGEASGRIRREILKRKLKRKFPFLGKINKFIKKIFNN
mgnify:CR=1 FL=1